MDKLTDTLNQWVAELPRDAEVLRDVLVDEGAGPRARRLAAAALGYLLRKIDLIPDHFAGLGRVDDAFVLRIAAAQALEAGLDRMDYETALGVLRLADEALQVKECLEGLYPLLHAYVERLPELSFRGRRSDQLVLDREVQNALLREVRAELADYNPGVIPALGRHQALGEIKLFLASKLPREVAAAPRKAA